MVIPFAPRKKRPGADVNHLTHAFIFLKTPDGKSIILRLADVQVKTANSQTTITGKSIRLLRREGKKGVKM
ncbi:hypothetical protein [Lihuaxuella thermophila]|uniref:Uncharacterized protein n=1 Tax=Lihuaxuella thermophila TaxID=1173111 RepID=A0A1H8H279_9BACL|nr:hypothetical protein [Lihuaxuella thermophila]SEN50235.1 hypothetical protein SAMN05444955_1133 [Lihuaxuella thermophila]